MPDLNATSTSSAPPGTPAPADPLVERYRKQEARLTSRLRLLMVIVVVAVAVGIYAISAGDGTNIGVVFAGALVCLAAAAQVRAMRNRIRQLLESGAVDEIANRIEEAKADPQAFADPPSLFSQQYCRVNRQFAGGRLQAGQVPPVFLVVVRDGRLTVVQAPATPVMQVPVAGIRIATPGLQRKFGTLTTLRIGEQVWGVDFGGVYQAERHANALRQLFSFGSLRKSMGRARELNSRFVAALLESGAASQ